MLPDRVSNPGPLTYESDALPIALRGPAGLSGSLGFGTDMLILYNHDVHFIPKRLHGLIVSTSAYIRLLVSSSE